MTQRRSTEPRDLVPPIPPEPTLSERFAGLGYKLDEGDEDTFIRPETMLRRALMAIDPAYADRTEIHSDGDDDDSSPGEFVPKRPYHTSGIPEGGHDEANLLGLALEEGEADTARNRAQRLDSEAVEDLEALDPNDETTRERVGDLVAAAARKPRADASPPARAKPSPSLVPGIAAFRVAVLPIPEEGDVRLLFIPPGADPPPGVAIALLVPPSEEDARMINEIYNETSAKL